MRTCSTVIKSWSLTDAIQTTNPNSGRRNCDSRTTYCRERINSPDETRPGNETEYESSKNLYYEDRGVSPFIFETEPLAIKYHPIKIDLPPSPKPSLDSDNDNMAAPQPNELSLLKPTPFNGDPTYLKQFIMDCKLYLIINRGVYDNDTKCIGFYLALLSEGTTATWKMQYYKVNRTANNGIFILPTVLDFLVALQDSFKEVDEEGSSLTCLERIKQGGRTVEQHNTDFKLLARRSGINLYCRSIS